GRDRQHPRADPRLRPRQGSAPAGGQGPRSRTAARMEQSAQDRAGGLNRRRRAAMTTEPDVPPPPAPPPHRPRHRRLRPPRPPRAAAASSWWWAPAPSCSRWSRRSWRAAPTAPRRGCSPPECGPPCLSAAATRPSLLFSTSNTAPDGTPQLGIDLLNRGTGPARVRWLEMYYRDAPLAD